MDERRGEHVLHADVVHGPIVDDAERRWPACRRAPRRSSRRSMRWVRITSAAASTAA